MRRRQFLVGMMAAAAGSIATMKAGFQDSAPAPETAKIAVAQGEAKQIWTKMQPPMELSLPNHPPYAPALFKRLHWGRNVPGAKASSLNAPSLPLIINENLSWKRVKSPVEDMAPGEEMMRRDIVTVGEKDGNLVQLGGPPYTIKKWVEGDNLFIASFYGDEEISRMMLPRKSVTTK